MTPTGANDPKYELAQQLGWDFELFHSFASPLIRVEMLEEMERLELSHQQIGLLFYLRAQPVQSLSEAAKAIRLSLPATSHLTERLVQRGLIDRSENPLNRRQKNIALAPSGLALLDRLEAATAKAYAQLLLHAPTETLDRLQSCTRILREALLSRPCTFHPHAQDTSQDDE
ncbi:MarR family winged helix-turn-helix transcriptional regulator [Deinococcus hopiensis]|uniref:DNA-binding transcriptional regulator, MarR family n=1 Tax=Deinococcus hopiensis KR-140 TaxID=695939 RepID=A0A1W1VX73_9DEIO|nr:MarR family transcriptional regulator [Deinococcus hopiensis]SMB97494.1 DNA-binding transcriptional regulator, MarR family [Deinococcus hopiensis KR-140]